VAGQLSRVKAKFGGERGGVAEADGAGPAVANLGSVIGEQQFDEGLGGLFAGVVRRQAGRVDPVPASFPRTVSADVLPVGFQAGGRYPFLAAFEHLIGELHQHPCGPLGSQPQHPHLDQVVGLPGPVRPRVPGLHQAPVGRPVLKLGLGHGGQISH
jgi:hypothetical protein